MCNYFEVTYLCGHKYAVFQICDWTHSQPLDLTPQKRRSLFFCGAPECFLSLDKDLLATRNQQLLSRYFCNKDEALSLTTDLESRAEEFMNTKPSVKDLGGIDILSNKAMVCASTGRVPPKTQRLILAALAALQLSFSDNGIVSGKLADLFPFLLRVSTHDTLMKHADRLQEITSADLPPLAATTPFNDLEPDAHCDICYEPLRASSRLENHAKTNACTSYCKHTFCTRCLVKYLHSTQNPNCPMCRSSWDRDMYCWPKVYQVRDELIPLTRAIHELVFGEESS